MPNRQRNIFETLNAVKVVLRWEVILTALAVSTVVLELQTGLALKFLRDPHASWPAFSAVLLQCLVFVVFCWGFYSIASEVFSSLHLPPEEAKPFLKILTQRPVSVVLLPVIFVVLFLLIFLVQTGLVAMIERFELPIWLYPLFYLLQFAAAIANIVLAAYVLINLFMWYPHLYSRNYKFESLLRSFHSLVVHNTYRTLLYTTMWVVITVLVFSYFLFPVWKICVTETLQASRIALGDRFEQEVTGRDTFLADVVDSLSGETLTPVATYKVLAKKLETKRQNENVDPHRFRKVPTAGLLFLAALVLSFGLPTGIALALYSAAGSYSYRLILEAATRQADSGFFRQLTQREMARLERHLQGTPQAQQAEPQPDGNETPDDDECIEEIPVEPVSSKSGRRKRISPLEAKDEPARPANQDAPSPASQEEALGKYVDFDYRKQTDPGGKKFGSSNGKPKERKKETEEKPERESKRKFIRESKQQKAPEKETPDDEDDYTIFDDM
ncbi:MAG: hypothetical protein U5N86_03880 [Planctomycetota bacterium]|nr:hypothetical protein [Planctomycetota bacterium]